MEAADRKLHNLMYGLLYPAILGAGIALLVAYVLQVGLQDAYFVQRVSLGVITLLLFCVSYGNAFDPSRYGSSAFFLDTAEIVFMGICFWSLNLFYKDIGGPVKFGWFSFSLSFTLLVVQSMWLKLVGKNPAEGRYLIPRVAAVLVILAGYLCRCTWGVLAESGALLVILGIYVKKNWKPDVEGPNAEAPPQ